ncbi:TM2 domain-containing protein [Arthrobacter sp. LAPM80]|uniref:TM2 domain-containing protein n=1 Tax=Arthrobacter sp. LAPM80 TaxID=3141788 RepID=UPI00398AA7A3
MSENIQPEQTPANGTDVPAGYDQPAPGYQAPPRYEQPAPYVAPAAPSYEVPAAAPTPEYPQSGVPQGYPQENMQQAYPPPGMQQSYQQGYQQPPYGVAQGVEQKSKLVAGILGILLGGFGIHNFYLGKTKIALIQLLVSVISFGILYFFMAVWGLIEGIMILIGQENYRTDGNGVPLKD